MKTISKIAFAAFIFAQAFQAYGTHLNYLDLDSSSSDYVGNTVGSDNTRTYTESGVNVTVQAWSQLNQGTAFTQSFLGRYGSGLGVTNDLEGNGSNNKHTLDNIGSYDYIYFKFDKLVDIRAVKIGYVVADSDLEIWIGTDVGAPTTSSFFSDFDHTEESWTSSSNSRTAWINSGGVVGNRLLLAAITEDSTPEDRMKIKALKFSNVPPPTHVPDSGSSVLLLGLGIVAIALARFRSTKSKA